MKYVVFLSDGMADRPIDALGGQTPMMRARKPHMDRMAREGAAGLIQTIPDGVPPGSDTANMSVMGYDPIRYYTGRSPLEAVSMGVPLRPDDVAFRTNLVTLGGHGAYETREMTDYSADEIGSDDAAILVQTLNEQLAAEGLRFYPGISYRHCMVWHRGPLSIKTTPPHDILTQTVGSYLPRGEGAERLLALMRQSLDMLETHPINRARVDQNLHPANAIWIWGQGTKPGLPHLADLYGVRGSVISAVDLIRGLGICMGIHVVAVPGATGNIHTNFIGKGEAAIVELARGQDYVYIHVEAPDECGHRAELENKIHAIERIDQDIIGPVWSWLEAHRRATGEAYRILILPDHATPIELRTHTREAVPFAIFDSSGERFGHPAADAYDEEACARTGWLIEKGHTLFGRFVSPGGF